MSECDRFLLLLGFAPLMIPSSSSVPFNVTRVWCRGRVAVREWPGSPLAKSVLNILLFGVLSLHCDIHRELQTRSTFLPLHQVPSYHPAIPSFRPICRDKREGPGNIEPKECVICTCTFWTGCVLQHLVKERTEIEGRG